MPLPGGQAGSRPFSRMPEYLRYKIPKGRFPEVQISENRFPEPKIPKYTFSEYSGVARVGEWVNFHPPKGPRRGPFFTEGGCKLFGKNCPVCFLSTPPAPGSQTQSGIVLMRQGSSRATPLEK